MISRDYALGALCLWLACAATRSSRPALYLGGALFALMQTTIYGFLVGLPLSSGWMVDRWLRRGELPPLMRRYVAGGSCWPRSGWQAVCGRWFLLRT